VKIALSMLSLAFVAIVAACSGGGSATTRPTLPAVPSVAVPSVSTSLQPAGSGALPAAAELCSLLTANDWATVQLSQAAAQPTINSDGPGSAYCTYTAAAGASGGLEFDAFVDNTAADADGTYNTIVGETPGGQPGDLPGADAVLINTDVDGKYGAIIVRNGRFIYSISLPTSNGAQTQLETLAALILARAQQYK
jgi:hypothetical protein